MAERAQTPLARGLHVHLRVVHGLIVRDMMLRYGRDNIGFLWVVIEPMILTAAVLVLFSQIKGEYHQGTHVLSMVLTGYMPLTLWRHTTNPGTHLLRSAGATLYHRNITVLDVFIARMLLEGIGTTAALTMVYGSLLVVGLVEPIAKPGHLIAGWLLLWWLGSAVALILAAVTELNETSERFIQPLQYMIVPLSGIFFMIDWLPHRLQQIILYNPLANCIELFRDGLFGDQVRTHHDAGYVIVFAIVTTWLGLTLFERARRQLTSQ